MVFLSLKIAMLVAAFKFTSGGGRKSALRAGVLLAILFAFFAYLYSGFSAGILLVELALGLFLCPLVLFLYWKQDGVLPAMVVAGVGSVFLLFILPVLAYACAAFLPGT